MLRFTNSLRLATLAALLVGAPLAHAQYSWIGENGVRQFSDRPPPPSTPAHKILKQPRRAAAPAAEPAPAPAASRANDAAFSLSTESGPLDVPPGPGAAVRKGPPNLAQQDAAYRERVKQREEQDTKAQQETQRKRELAERCESARQVKAQGQSGIRVAKIDANGERRFLTDEEKAADAARADKVLADCR